MRSLLRGRSDAIEQRHTAYQQWRDAVAGINITADCTVDQHIDRSHDKEVGYSLGL